MNLTRPARRLAVLAVLLIPAVTAAADKPAAKVPEALARRLEALAKSHQGEVTVAVKHLKNGETFFLRENEVMPTASLIKFPVMVEAYRQAEAGIVKLDDRITLKPTDKVPGSGVLTKHFSPGAEISLRDAIRLMIAYSDNTATNLVLDRIGIAAVGKAMTKLGLPNTAIHAKVFRRDTSVDINNSRRYGLGRTTAKETLQLYEQLYAGKLLGPKSAAAMKEHLYACEDRGKLARSLPTNVKLAHKGGAVSAVRCDAGVMETPSGPIAVCVFTRNNRDKSWADDNAAHRLIGEIARRVYFHYNPSAPTKSLFTGTLKSGDSGDYVEALQRTLNARLKPSPELDIDGDYGPVTEAAVKTFQQARGLKVTGIAGPETWKALGTLITTPAPVPPPSVVNGEKLKREPADDLDGTPYVTAKAWAIADGKTGKILWGHNADKPRDFASTTKIMTAYLVCELAKQNPKVLDEVITYSERADNTPGSTSGLKAGEKATVREVLYGLMLPSGNDASVALAEHFGPRLAAETGKKKPSGDPHDLFVAAMNRAAKRLGMKETHYENPHGLTAKGHVASPRDLATLAHAARRNPLFRGYINTRQHGTTVTGPGGYRRNVVWKNTNQLLKIDGYSGVKTGTTTAAGACLVSYGERGDKSLIVVILGSAASAARYTDSRNLYRWAWRQRR